MKLILATVLSLCMLAVLAPQTYADAQTDAAAELAIASALAAHHRKAPASDDPKLFSQAEVDQMIDNAVFKDRLDRELEAQKSAPAAQYVDVRVCDGNSCHIERRLRSAECPNGLCPNGQCASGQCVSGCDCTNQLSGTLRLPVGAYTSYGSSGGCSSGMCGSSGGGCSSGNCGSSGGGRGFFRRGR